MDFKQNLQIIKIQNAYVLVEVLNTCQCKIYYLKSDSYYTELTAKISQNKFTLTATELNYYFSMFNIHSNINFVQRCKSSTLVSYGNRKSLLVNYFNHWNAITPLLPIRFAVHLVNEFIFQHEEII